MAHVDKIQDNETHFIIDPATRTITNASPGNNIIVQYDHNSERFTFEIPRYVDGHDMSESDEVRVHYLNSASTGLTKTPGMYICRDLEISKDDENLVTFSWVLSSATTQYIGSLYFSIQFVCFDGKLIDYAWNTGIYKDIVIIESINNLDELDIDPSSDVLEALKIDLAKEVKEVTTIYFTPQMYGAKADGVTDDTEAINAALKAHNNVYFPKGTYLVNGDYNGFNQSATAGIRVNSNQRILMDKDCIIQVKLNTTDYYNAFSVSDCENVVIEGGKIIGDRENHVQTTTHVQGYGVSFTDAKNCVLRGVEISQMYADGIVIHGSKGDELTGSNSNIVIENCIIHDCNRQGVSIIIGDHITMRDCEIYNINGSAPQSGIDIEPLEGNFIHDVLFDNIHIHDTNMASVYYSRCYNITFTNMRCDGRVEAVGKNHDILHDKCFYGIIDFRGDVYDVMVSNSIIGMVYLYEDPIVNFNNCIINGHHTFGALVQAPSFTGSATFENCKMALKNVDTSSYKYFMWSDAKATGCFVCVNCDIDIPEENATTYFLSVLYCDVELRGCFINHNGTSNAFSRMTRRLIMSECTLKSKTELGFVIDTDRPFSFIVTNNHIDTKQRIAHMTLTEFTSEYNFIVENNYFTWKYEHVNANITNVLTKAVDANNHVIVNV